MILRPSQRKKRGGKKDYRRRWRKYPTTIMKYSVISVPMSIAIGYTSDGNSDFARESVLITPADKTTINITSFTPAPSLRDNPKTAAVKNIAIAITTLQNAKNMPYPATDKALI